jgi:hypothetical protein
MATFGSNLVISSFLWSLSQFLLFSAFVDFFAGNVLNFMMIQIKRNYGHTDPLTAIFWSETQNFRDFHIFLDDKLAVKTILTQGGGWDDFRRTEI